MPAICMEVLAYLIWIPGSRLFRWNIRSRFTRRDPGDMSHGQELCVILIMKERLVQENSQKCSFIVSALTGYCNPRHWLACRRCREWCLCARCPCSAWMRPCKRWTQVARTTHDIVQDAKTSRGIPDGMSHAKKIVNARSRLLECANTGNVPIQRVCCSHTRRSLKGCHLWWKILLFCTRNEMNVD